MIAGYALVSVVGKADSAVATCVWGWVEGEHGVEQMLAAGNVLLGLT